MCTRKAESRQLVPSTALQIPGIEPRTKDRLPPLGPRLPGRALRSHGAAASVPGPARGTRAASPAAQDAAPPRAPQHGQVHSSTRHQQTPGGRHRPRVDLPWERTRPARIATSRRATGGTGRVSRPTRAREAGRRWNVWLRRPSSTRPAPARESEGIYLAFLSPRVRVRHWGGAGQGKVLSLWRRGRGEPNSPRQCWPQWAGRARRLRGRGGGGGGGSGDTARSGQRSSRPGGGAERSETCAFVQPSSPLAALHPRPITVGPALAKARPLASPRPSHFLALRSPSLRARTRGR